MLLDLNKETSWNSSKLFLRLVHTMVGKNLSLDRIRVRQIGQC